MTASTNVSPVSAAAPRVSVIVPCYNLGLFVEQAVDSVLAQTFSDVEIIIVNDGSTDPLTNDTLSKLQRPKTTVLTTENRGLPSARNAALALARGTYVCALDADDWLDSAFLEKTVSILDADPSVAFVSTWAHCFGIEEWIWRQDRCDFPKLLAECVVLTASPVRRTAIDAVGGFDPDPGLFGSEDWDLWIGLVERGFKGTIVPEPLFHYRQREGSMRRLADEPAVSRRVWQSLVEKHAESYQRHLPEVLLLLEEECGKLLLNNWELEWELETLRPPNGDHAADRPTQVDMGAEVEMLRAEVNRLRSESQGRLEALEQSRREVAAFRASKSWALMAPVRRAYDVWLALKRQWRAR